MLLRFKNRTEISVATILLEPLREGKPVVLVVDDPRLPKRKRIEKPLLFLTPQSIYGEPSKKIVISFQTHGCEVVDTEMGVKTLELMRLGIGGKMAVALAKSLNLVFNKGDNHGKYAT